MGRSKSCPKHRLDLCNQRTVSGSIPAYNNIRSCSSSCGIHNCTSIHNEAIYIRPSYRRTQAENTEHSNGLNDVAGKEADETLVTTPMITTGDTSVNGTRGSNTRGDATKRKQKKRRWLERKKKVDNADGDDKDNDEDSDVFQTISDEDDKKNTNSIFIYQSDDDNTNDHGHDDEGTSRHFNNDDLNSNKRRKLHDKINNNSIFNDEEEVVYQNLNDDNENSASSDAKEEQHTFSTPDISCNITPLDDKIEIIPCRRKDCRFIIWYNKILDANNDTSCENQNQCRNEKSAMETEKNDDPSYYNDDQRLIQSLSIKDTVLVYHQNEDSTTHNTTTTNHNETDKDEICTNNITNINGKSKLKTHKKINYNYVMKPQAIQNVHDNIQTIKEWIYKLQKRVLKRQQEQQQQLDTIDNDHTTGSANTAVADDSILSLSESSELSVNLDSIQLAMDQGLLEIIIRPKVDYIEHELEHKSTSQKVYSIDIHFYLTTYALSICSPQSLGQNILTQSSVRTCKKNMRQRYDHALIVQSVFLDMFPTSILADFGVFGSEKVHSGDKSKSGQLGGEKQRSSSKSKQAGNRNTKNSNDNGMATVVTAKMVYDAIDNVHLNKEMEQKQTYLNDVTSRQEQNTVITNVSNTDSCADSYSNCENSSGQSYNCRPKIKGLVPTLREYQQLAVEWMIKRESGKAPDYGWEICWVVFVKMKRKDDKRLDASSIEPTANNLTLTTTTNQATQIMEISPEYTVTTLFKFKEMLKQAFDELKNCSLMYYNPVTGWLVTQYEDAKRHTLNEETIDGAVVRGGILAESMGLGKTVELLACILSNPYKKECLENEGAIGNTRDCRNEERTSSIQVNTTNINTSEHKFSCYCGRDETTHSLPWVTCSQCRQTMHGVCAGFTSRSDLIEKTMGHPRLCDESNCPFCQFKSRQHHKIDSRATLIVTPPSILNQWTREIRKHTSLKNSNDPTSLKVLVYPGVKELSTVSHVKAAQNHSLKMLLPLHLADADIVLTTFDTLRAELAHSNENPFLQSRRVIRKVKKYKVVPTPLISIKWWRICLDEAQKIETSTASSAKMALNLVAHNRWCVSGTPIGRGKIDDLFGLYLFLNAKPFCYKRCLDNYLRPNMRDIDHRIKHCTFDVMWRSTKAHKDVKAQINIPVQTENKVVLHFSSVERHFYQRQLENTINVASFAMDKSKIRARKKEVINLTAHLHRLRAACCHPQVGSSAIAKVTKKKSCSNNGLPVTNGVLSMSQILYRLIEDAKVKAEESLRVFTLHTNALASLKRLKGESLSSGVIDAQLMRQCCDHYFEALQVADKNSIPSPINGEAILSGSNGFQFPCTVVQDGEGRLLWKTRKEIDELNCSPSMPELWARFDFTGSMKKISSFMVRVLTKKDIDTPGEPVEILFPKDCVLQVSSAAMNGIFVDAIPFTLGCPTKDNGNIEWKEFFGVIPYKSKSWRVYVKSFHHNFNPQKNCEPTSHYCVGLDVQLMEPDIVYDNIQRIHVLHNLTTSLKSLLVCNDSPYDNLSEKYSKSSIQTKINELNEECIRLESHYIEAARVMQQASDCRLKDCTKARKQVLAEMNDLSEGIYQPWPIDLLTWCHLYGDSSYAQSICNHVERRLFELFDDPTQSFRRRSFPWFNNLNGLSLALSNQLEKGYKVLSDLDIPLCISKVEKLSEHPQPQEVLENSQCRKCRADWQQLGPICQSCKLEAELVKYQEEMKEIELNCVLQALAEWIRENIGRIKSKKSGKGISTCSLKNIHERMEKFFEFKDTAQKELECARVKWRTHFDLLSDIDELNQCKRSMRLAYENENLLELSQHELAFIVQPCDIASLILDHTTKQAMSEAELRRSKEKLRFLQNQNLDQKEGTNDNICTICLNSFGNDRAVLRCGHVFHYSPCVERLLKRGNLISCPMRCAIRTPKAEILIASEKSKVDGSKATRTIKGSWGTKIDRLISDLIGVVEKGEKSLVFSQWDDMLSIMEHALKANNIEYVRPKSVKKMGDVMDVFRTNHCHVLLLHIKHGAEGLTLIEANHVFMVEPLLNHSIDSQAINRIHRIGQTQRTYVHRYLIEDTVEMKIDKIRMTRQTITDSVGMNGHMPNFEMVCDAGGFDGGCSRDELKNLLY